MCKEFNGGADYTSGNKQMCKMYSDQWGEIDSSKKIERKVYLDSVNIPGV